MVKRPHRPAELTGQVFRGSAARREGLLTADHLRGPAWQKLFPDVYADAELAPTHLLKCRAAALILPPYAAITGRSAACLDRLPLGEPNEPVQVLIPPDRRFQTQGIRVRRARLPAGHLLPGTPTITVPQRTTWEIASEPDQVEAVVALDILFHHKYLRPAAMDSWTKAHPRSRAAKTLALADGRAESPQETRTRLQLVAAGLPTPVPQYKLWVNGRYVARLDLAWPAAKVAAEYDGAHHAEIRQLIRDHDRSNKLLDAGWVVFHLTAAVLKDPVLFARFTTQLRAALSRTPQIAPRSG